MNNSRKSPLYFHIKTAVDYGHIRMNQLQKVKAMVDEYLLNCCLTTPAPKSSVFLTIAHGLMRQMDSKNEKAKLTAVQEYLTNVIGCCLGFTYEDNIDTNMIVFDECELGITTLEVTITVTVDGEEYAQVSILRGSENLDDVITKLNDLPLSATFTGVNDDENWIISATFPNSHESYSIALTSQCVPV